MSNKAKETKDISLTKAYLILKPKTITTEADERSKSNPGHGYPSETLHLWDIWTCGTAEEWHSQIKAMTAKGEDFVPLIGNRPLVKTEMVSSIDGRTI